MVLPVVTKDLAFHFETAEAEYYEAKLRALAENESNSRGVEISRTGRAILFSIQSRRNNPSVNRVMRFTSADLDNLETYLQWVRDRADSFWFDITPPLVDEDVMIKLVDAGLYPSRFANTVYTIPEQHDHQPAPGIATQIADLSDPAELKAC